MPAQTPVADDSPVVATESVEPVTAKREVHHLRDLSPEQVKSGLAAWLGWLFDGLDMHLYTLVAGPLVALLLAVDKASPDVKEKSAWIQAAFLVGWALGGGFFGRLGDLLGRSRALSLTILTYALFTGLSFFVTNWEQLLVCRFLAALGIGGEWAVGSSLLSETWPAKWRAWVAAVLQTGVNIGVILACGVYYVLADGNTHHFLSGIFRDLPSNFYLRAVFLVGIVPALLVYWIRHNVPEPAEWAQAKAKTANDPKPSVLDLFRGKVRRTTLLTIGVCSFSLSGWWAFMFWSLQHVRQLPSLSTWTEADREQLIAMAFLLIIGISSFGNFFAAWLARRLGYRNSIAAMCVLFTLTMVFAYYRERTHQEMLFFLPMVGFCSGVFGLFTMYLPPLFPTLLRTTGAGFSYNIGRIAAAGMTIAFAMGLKVTDLRGALLYVAFLFIPAALIAIAMPDLRDE